MMTRYDIVKSRLGELKITIRSLAQAPACLSDVEKLFKILFLEALKGRPDALTMMEFIQKDICDPVMSKRNTMARGMEDVITDVTNGVMMDTVARSLDSSLPIELAMNKRDKVDVGFENGYGISIKTFIGSNGELDLGSFNIGYLLKGLVDLGAGEGNIELKSTQLAKVLKDIEKNGQWSEFVKRFAYMVESIYVDDMVIVHKNDKVLDMFFVSKESVHNILIGAAKKGPVALKKVIIRFRHNALRVQRDFFLSPEYSTYLGFDFSKSQVHKISDITTRMAEIQMMILCGKTVTPEQIQNIAPVFTEVKVSSFSHISSFYQKLQKKFNKGKLSF